MKLKIDLNFNTYKAPTFKDKCFAWIDDNLKGWPIDYTYLGFAHTDGREMSFRNEGVNTGMWTQVYTRDEYLWWKLSDKFKKAVVKSVVRDVNLTYNKDFPDDSMIEFTLGRV